MISRMGRSVVLLALVLAVVVPSQGADVTIILDIRASWFGATFSGWTSAQAVTDLNKLSQVLGEWMATNRFASYAVVVIQPGQDRSSGELQSVLFSNLTTSRNFASDFDANFGTAVRNYLTLRNTELLDWAFGWIFTNRADLQLMSSNILFISDFSWSDSYYNRIWAALGPQASGGTNIFLLSINVLQPLDATRTTALTALANSQNFVQRSFLYNVTTWGQLSGTELNSKYRSFADGGGGPGVITLPPGQGFTPPPPGPPGFNTPPPDVNVPETFYTSCLREADIVFVVDSSSSIRLAAGGTNRYWEMQIDFIIRLIDRFEIGPSDVRIGVVSFATKRTEVVVRIQLGNHGDKASLQAEVRNIPFTGGYTATGEALSLMRQEFNQRGRTYPDRTRNILIPRVAILITDGRPNPDILYNYETEAKEARQDEGVIIAAIGVGSLDSFAFNFLDQMASRKDLVTQIESFLNLPQELSRVYTQVLCQVQLCGMMRNVDLTFILDASSSMLSVSGGWNLIQDYIADILQSLAINYNSRYVDSSVGARVALVLYGRNGANIIFDLDDHLNVAKPMTEMMQKVYNAQVMGGIRSNPEAAFKIAREQVYTTARGDRSVNRNVVIFITDSKPSDAPAAIAEATLLKDDKSVTILTVSIAEQDFEHQAAQGDLRQISSAEPEGVPNRYFLYYPMLYTALGDQVYNMLQDTCSVMEWTIVPGGVAQPGPDGPPGPPGPAGPPGGIGITGGFGFPGPGGPGGPSGFPGPPGSIGPDGSSGPPGPFGLAGTPGRQGLPGDTGTAGFSGRDGGTGNKGQAGSPGLPGKDGAAGLPGSGFPGGKGQKGSDGRPGTSGSPGRSGSGGTPGVPGEKGETGALGFPGSDGGTGFPGRPGSPGTQGTPGRAGLPGVGVPGRPGGGGFTGDTGFPGSPGFDGNIGLPGDSGRIGDTGTPGRDGSRGTPGFSGRVGATGASGTPGSNGFPGQGQPGRPGGPGSVGDTGRFGLPGSPGLPGSQGPGGDTGAIGQDGFPGGPGSPGRDGSIGATGPGGQSGLPGVPGVGIMGATGASGPPGFGGQPGLPGGLGFPGSVGKAGVPGVIGSPGLPGFAGFPGLPGRGGDQGDTGPAGTDGAPGFGLPGREGFPGRPGSPGGSGNRGLPGSPGDNGKTGVRGTAGGPGRDGSPGGPGQPGNPGPQGFTGHTGIPGEGGFGKLGATGVPGRPGELGRRGNDGFPGTPGADGATGIPGRAGVSGRPGGPGGFGATGFPGNSGRPGQPGPSGTIGDTGVAGRDAGFGRPGPQGATGLTGGTGATGSFGTIGATGPPGPRQGGGVGDTGPKGPPGPPGPLGVPGAGEFRDQCLVDNGQCQQLCVATFFSYYCACYPGYTLLQYADGDPSKTACRDVARPGFNGAGVEIVAGGGGSGGSGGGSVGGGSTGGGSFGRADIVFVVDASSSTFNFWSAITNFLVSLVQQLNAQDGVHRFGFVSFSGNARVEFSLNQNDRIQRVQDSIRNIRNIGGSARIYTGLQAAKDLLLDTNRGARAGILNIMVVLTAGNDQLDSPETRRVVDDIRREAREKIGVVALGIGPVDSNRLRNTLTLPNNWAYSVPDFNSLPQAVFQLTNYIQAAATQAGGSGGNGLVDPLPKGGACANKLDLAIIIDGSGSINQQNKFREWPVLLTFVIRLLETMGVNYLGTRVGIIVFSEQTYVHHTLDNTWDISGLKSLLTRLQKPEYLVGGRTCIACGLQAAREVIFNVDNGDRTDVQNFAILITDAKANERVGDTQREAQLLKQSGATIVAVGITRYAHMAELTDIATSPDYVFYSERYSFLMDKVDEVINLACNQAGQFPRADIAIVLDISENADNFDQVIKQQVLVLLTALNIGPQSDARIGIIVYSSSVDATFISLTGDINRIKSDFTQMRVTRGRSSSIYDALNFLREQFFTQANGDRLDVPNIALFFTAGADSTDPRRGVIPMRIDTFIAEAGKVRTAGIAVVAIGTSQYATLPMLRSYAFRSELALSFSSYIDIEIQKATVVRAAWIAVGMVYVPHWRPYIPRNQLCFDTCCHGIQCFCWDDKRSLNSSTCINVNECLDHNGWCSHGCVDMDGSYLCTCPEGLQLKDDGYVCGDINECQANPCASGAKCINTYGGYTCLDDARPRSGASEGDAPNSGGEAASPAAGGSATLATGTLVGTTIASAIGTAMLMCLIGLTVRSIQRRSNKKPDASMSTVVNGHANHGFQHPGSTLEASKCAFDDISLRESEGDTDSLSSANLANIM